MKKTFFAAFCCTAALAAATLTSCTQKITHPSEILSGDLISGEDDSLPEDATRVAFKAASAPSSFSSLQIFAFREDGEIIGHKLTYGGKIPTMVLPRVKCEFIAYANLPTIDSTAITKKSDLTLSDIRVNSDKWIYDSSFFGKSEKCDFSSSGVSETATITMTPHSSKITVSKYSRAFSKYDTRPFKLISIYLSNVDYECKLDGTPIAGQEVGNPTIYRHDLHQGSRSFHYMSFSRRELENNAAPVEIPSEFKMVATGHNTRLMIETLIGEDTYYYPVILPPLAAGQLLVIDSIVFTKEGNKDPEDNDVTALTVSFNIITQDWEEDEHLDWNKNIVY